MKEKPIEIKLVEGVEGNSLYFNDTRICGPKPWGGGKIKQKWETKLFYVTDAIPELAMKNCCKKYGDKITEMMNKELFICNANKADKGFLNDLADFIFEVSGNVNVVQRLKIMATDLKGGGKPPPPPTEEE